MRAKLSSKGQLVIPFELRESQGWDAGTEFDIELTPKGFTAEVIMTKPFPITKISDSLGILPPKHLNKSDEELRQLYLDKSREYWKEKEARSQADEDEDALVYTRKPRQ